MDSSFVFSHFFPFDANNSEIDEAKQSLVRVVNVLAISLVVVSKETCISCKESIQISESIELYRTT